MGQLLLSDDMRMQVQHGGELSVGKRKRLRPLDPHRPLHIVMRTSRVEAGDVASFRTEENREAILRSLSLAKRRFGITVYALSVNSNHLHLIVQGRRRWCLQHFLRAFAGMVARAVTGARRGRSFGKLWDLPVWTRIVEWGKDFRGALGYVRKNILEASGSIPYEARPHRRKVSRPLRS
jgi:hypothetical protein